MDAPMGSRSESARSIQWGPWLLGMGLVLLLGGVPVRAPGQVTASDTLNLIERYRTARHQTLARSAEQAGWTASPRPPRPLSVAVDSLFRSHTSPDTSAADPLAFPIDTARRVHRLERDWFRDTFGDTDWSFLGASTEYSFFDTTYTRDLRARLQAQFGDPTLTLADRPAGERTGEPQFEYWFVVNDSIPVRVVDTNGPRDRGVVVSTDRRLRDRLDALRATLLAPLRQPKRAPYVDYYAERPAQNETWRWYRTGFDGQSFFLEPISKPDILPGRRPRLDDPVPTDSSQAGRP